MADEPDTFASALEFIAQKALEGEIRNILVIVPTEGVTDRILFTPEGILSRVAAAGVAMPELNRDRRTLTFHTGAVMRFLSVRSGQNAFDGKRGMEFDVIWECALEAVDKNDRRLLVDNRPHLRLKKGGRVFDTCDGYGRRP